MQTAHHSQPQPQQSSLNAWAGQMGTVAAVVGVCALASLCFSGLTVMAVATPIGVFGAYYAMPYYNQLCKPDTPLHQRKAATV